MRMKHPWNAGWWFRPGKAEDAFLSDDWIGPSAAHSPKNKTIISKEIFMQVQLFYESPILSPTKPRQLTMVKDTETTFLMKIM